MYVFIDEVHFLENWHFFIKKYFDRKYPIKFLVSGSAATLIRKGAESLAGRTIEDIIYPFSFYEFLSFKKQDDNKLINSIVSIKDRFRGFALPDITELIPYVDEVKIIFEEYIEKGGFPNLFEIKEPLLWKRLLREDIVEKVIYRDMVKLYDIKKPEALERLFLCLTNITSQILSVANIANSLGLSREYTEKYLHYLEQAILIRRLKKYARSVEKSIRSAEKVHIIDPGLLNAFSVVETGQAIETIVVNHLLRLKDATVYYYRERYEVDVIIGINNTIYPIEIKYTDSIKRQDIKGIEVFCKKFGVQKMIIVNRNMLKQEKINGCEALFIPAWLFTLLIG